MNKKVFKVLVIDDAFFIRNLIKRAITTKPDDLDYTFEVIGEAKNGKEGIVEYFKLNPDFITLDLNMPDINGVEVVKQIQSKNPNVKVIVISGREDEKLKEEIMKLGSWFYVKKPFQNAFLWEEMDKMVELILAEENQFPSSSSEEGLSKETTGEKVSNKDSSISQDAVIKSDDEEEDDLFINTKNMKSQQHKENSEIADEIILEIGNSSKEEFKESSNKNAFQEFSTNLEFDIDEELHKKVAPVITAKEDFNIELPDNSKEVPVKEEINIKNTNEEISNTVENHNEIIKLKNSNNVNEPNERDNNEDVILIESTDVDSDNEINISSTILDYNISNNNNNISNYNNNTSYNIDKEKNIVDNMSDNINNHSSNKIDSKETEKFTTKNISFEEEINLKNKILIKTKANKNVSKRTNLDIPEVPKTCIKPIKATEKEYKKNISDYNTINSINKKSSTVEAKKGEVSIAPPRSKILEQIYSGKIGFETIDNKENIETNSIGEDNKLKNKGLFASIKNLFNKK